jgi:hypothetical protein
LELDDALFARSNAALENALAGGKQLTRAELAAVLEQAGISASGMRLGYIVHRAELDAVVCSGARRGKQFTYALLDERAPQVKTLPRDEALAELTKRFFTSHGPAQVHDFAWWSGLTIADATAGLEMNKPQLVRKAIDGKAYWRADSVPTAHSHSPTVLLLAPYDEYTIAYKDHSATLDPAYMEQVRSNSPNFTAFYTIDGRLEGMWKRTFSKGAVVIATSPFRPLSAAERAAFAAEAARFGDFLGLPVSVEHGA